MTDSGFSPFKIAIVHDWLVTFAGAERVLAEILALYPSADLYSVVDFMPASDRGLFGGRPVRTTWVQWLPGARRRYRSYLPLMPWAVERLDLSGYDLVISSSHAVAKGVATRPDQPHVCYCHSPMRYAWDMREEYLREAGLAAGLRGLAARFLLERLRRWDQRNSDSVDHFIANSGFIAKRIRLSYGRDSTVIHPPVDTVGFAMNPAVPRENYYLTVSRMVPYKRVNLIVEAFSRMPERRLIVVGSGPQEKEIRRLAGPNVRLLGYQQGPAVRDLLQRARAFVFAAQEDFGIAPMEAQACGTPVIGYGQGGLRETIRPLDGPEPPTGVFFDAQSVESLCEAVELFERQESEICPASCRQNAERFGADRFRREFAAYMQPFLPAPRT